MKRKYIACRRVLVLTGSFEMLTVLTDTPGASFLKKSNECLLFSVEYGMMTKNFEYNSLQ